MTLKNGVTYREHYEQVEKSSGHTPEELDIGECPDDLFYLYTWFLEMHGSRGFNQAGPCPITFDDIIKWQALYRISLEPWEVRTIKFLDGAYLKVSAEHMRKSM